MINFKRYAGFCQALVFNHEPHEHKREELTTEEHGGNTEEEKS
jgi:hypothetical protein